MKKLAVPSLNLPGQNLKKKANAFKRKKRTLERCVKKMKLEKARKKLQEEKSIAENNEKADKNVDQMDLENEINMDSVNESDCANEHGDVETPVFESTEEEPLYKDEAIQVDSGLYFNMIKSEKDLNTMTGIPNFKILNLIKDIAEVVLFSTGCKTTKLSLNDRIIMTFIKLKQNISYSMLSAMFQICSEENCRKVVLRMLDVLSTGLKFAIRWPSKYEILKNIPDCFTNFEDVRAVIDGIEIFIQQPKNLCCRLASYSSYKGTNTVKFVTAVSPAGLIIYISKPYLGRSSDKAVFEESNFIKFFDKGDALMTDKSFLIDEMCLLHDVKLIRPPFLKNKQLSKEEALLNASIAKARVHIERSNQRIKVFKILSTKLPSYLVPKIEQIFTIICAIVNLSSPILKDDKFNK